METKDETKKNDLPLSKDFYFTEEVLGTTKIDISGRVCEVEVRRLKNGNLEIEPIDPYIRTEGGWLYEGTCTEGYDDEVIISAFRH